MNLDRAIMVFAGVVLLASLALGWFVSPWWLLLSAFVGLNLIQAPFTGGCPASFVMKKLGVKPGAALR
ncbi:MAG: DUF2892 domain-containing protein [Rhizobiales bacterium]|nr:DUF2892 domain-containing protein [Hyphomicrobiales bacterium]MBN9009133.1 DUF2892 domain-containing protein [Hyphomicrobiales bacterium]